MQTERLLTITNQLDIFWHFAIFRIRIIEYMVFTQRRVSLLSP